MEVGALHRPLSFDGCVAVRLDRMGSASLKEHYAKTRGQEFADRIEQVHLVAARPPYDFIDTGAFDFVFGSHVLEHMPNPGLALREWVRVTKAGGIVYSIVPDKNNEYDESREATPVDVLMAAFHGADPAVPRRQYQDALAGKGEEVVEEAWRDQADIHVYTYTPETVQDFFGRIAPEIGAKVELFFREGISMHLVLRKEEA